MTLTRGTAVGPYEILAPIGSGGMGEVYRARDPRIGRDVAVKVLPSAASGEPERQRRFEKEARAAGALNHPNVLAVYDVGTHEGFPYIVSELLEGETLRARIGGSPLPTRKALDYVVQVASGLAAAHEKGIVHRDLKPDNLFVTKDGRVKILDFGLAKLGPDGPLDFGDPDLDLSAMETATGTLPGTLLGTLGYMSPEQVQGLPPDARSDIFAFGTVLFEMLTGRRAFKAPTAPETLTAILRVDPLETTGAEGSLPTGLERVVRHCLEKSPDERFQSAKDLAFALEALSGPSDTVSTRMLLPDPVRHRSRAALRAAAIVMAAGLGLVAGWGLWRREMPRSSQLTFGAGVISDARFSPDGQTIVYSAAWDGGPLRLYALRPGEGVARPFGPEGARVWSISPSGEVAIQLLAEDSPATHWLISRGTLARIPLAGGTPRKILEDVLSADWSPDGSDMAVSRFVEAEGVWRLEYPIGNALYDSDVPISVVRVSPRGDRVAFLEVILEGGRVFNAGRLSVVNREGEKRTLYEGQGTIGIAWASSAREIWTHSAHGGARAIRAVSLDGESRLVTLRGGVGYLTDLSSDDRVLFTEVHGRWLVFARAPGEERERNLSRHHDSSLVDLSRDGHFVLFNEVLSSIDRRFRTSVRGTDGSPAIRLGDGYGLALSPDGQWALALAGAGSTAFVLLPTGAGEKRTISHGLPAAFFGVSWLPDSSGFVFSGGSPGETARLFLQSIDGDSPRRLTDVADDLEMPAVSPDGETIAAIDNLYDDIVLVSRRNGAIRDLPGAKEGEVPVQWRPDGRALYVYNPHRLPVEVFQVDVPRGHRQRLEGIVLADMTGADGDVILDITPDARSYAYSFYRPLDELYLIEGLR